MNKKEIVEFLRSPKEEADALFKEADRARKENVGDFVHLRGIVEFSSYCRCSCLYCGLRRENRELERYRLSVDEIVDVVREGCEAGYRTVVLQSGEDMYYTSDIIVGIVRKIKELFQVRVTLSVGERSYEEYKAFKEAGADRYLLKHETANSALYNRLHPHSSFENRLRCLQDLKKLGYQVGSGFMIGLPGQTVDDLADDLLLLRELEVQMAGIGPFIPHPHTPLGGEKAGDPFLTLKALAVLRLLLPKAHLPVTTALATLDSRKRWEGLFCGGNVLMLKLTPEKVRSLYEIYPRGRRDLSVYEERKEVEYELRRLGRNVSEDYGDAF